VINKILPCVIGLGYVGLPVFIRLNKKFSTTGFDINKKRIAYLKKKIDINGEIRKSDLKLNHKSLFTNSHKDIYKSNFYIVTVPTPLKNNTQPDLTMLENATKLIARGLKKNDVIIYESTVYPGTTLSLTKKILEKKTNLQEGKDFFVGYSPERINPGDKKHNLNNTPKILAYSTNNKNIKHKIQKIYNSISSKLHLSKSIEEAESAKVIENIQRDLNIALMNDIFIFSRKMKYNYSNIIKLASTKWNFLKFKPGLVGGHCLPVDPYYLYYIAKKNKILLKTVLAGRQVNTQMKNFVLKEILTKISQIKNKNKNPKILIAGITYKNDVADIRNSYALDIYLKLKKKYKNTKSYDYVCDPITRKKYKILSKINKNLKYDLIVFLVNHKKNKKLYKYAQNKKIEILDPFAFN